MHVETHPAKVITNHFFLLKYDKDRKMHWVWTSTFNLCDSTVPECPVAMFTMQQLIFIRDQLYRLVLFHLCERLECSVIAVVCRALSLQSIITLHCCVIYLEHNGFLNNSWALWKQLLPHSECLLASCFCAQLRCSPLCQQHRYGSQIVFRLSTCAFSLV